MNFQRKQEEVLIAVSGHRMFRHVLAVEYGILHTLPTILESWSAKRFCILTALADGADRLVVKAAHAAGEARYIAMLPMDASSYSEDFSPESEIEFYRLLNGADSVEVLEGNLNREEAYLQAGVAVLDACDVLLAIWDGEEALGRGGTGEIVQQARERELPLAWIYAPRSCVRRKTPGLVQFERFPETLNTQM